MARKVLEPININGMTLKNRIGYAPFLPMPVNPGGSVNSETIRWFEERARNGVGFMMTGNLEILPPHLQLQALAVKMEVGGGAIHDDSFIPGWAELNAVMHSYGVKMGAQVGAAGTIAGEGPSSAPYPNEASPRMSLFDLAAGTFVPCEVVSLERMEMLKNAVAAAAGRAKAAGFDCVSLHCGHGAATMLGAFMSPYYNRRTDRYGGSWENRMRYTVETIEAIRNVVGKGYPLFVRVSADELLGDEGVTLEKFVRYYLPILEEAGVDAIDVSQGSVTHTTEGVAIPLYYRRGCFIQNAEGVKKATRLPVIGVGRILDVGMAEQFIEQGKADIIYLGSQLVADFETVKKYLEGRQDEIRKCIGCKPISCAVPCSINYDTRIVGRIPLTPAEKPKKVVVIGGGVGGMEAARVAALRGHKVILMEKEASLGGMVAALAEARMTGEFKNIVTYLGTQMRKLNVDVRVSKEATIADVDEVKPDVIIVACGSSMVIPEVAKDKLGVIDHISACREMKAIGQKVVVWGLVAAELAISLAEEGREVTMIGRGGVETIARDYPGPRQYYALRKLTDLPLPRVAGMEPKRVANPRVFLNVDVKEVSPEGIRLTSGDGPETIIPFDTLIISLTRTSNDSLFEMFQGKAAEVYKIGDCAKVGEIKEAIFAANEVARRI